MKGLVQIISRNRYPVLKTLRNRRPDVVNDTESEITILPVILRNNTCSDQVIDLLDHYLLLFELLPERIETLYAAFYLNKGNPILGQLFSDRRFYFSRAASNSGRRASTSFDSRL